MSDEIFKALQKVKYISNLQEITFGDFKNLSKDTNLLKSIKEGTTKIQVFKFLYNVRNIQVTGFLSVPKNISLLKKNKTIMCLRGGSKDFGAIRPGMIFNQGSYFSWFPLNGYVTLYTQYRGNSDSEGVDEFGGADIEDVKCLYKIIQKLDFCDDTRVGIMGWSRGAQMIYQLLKTEAWIKSVVAIAGPTDHIRMIEKNFRLDWKEYMTSTCGGSMSALKKRSALFWSEKMKKVPLLIIHGTKDTQVNVQDSIDLHKKLAHSTLKLYKDDHSLTINKEKAKRLVLNWFRKSL